jgi:hypothetical protein
MNGFFLRKNSFKQKRQKKKGPEGPYSLVQAILIKLLLEQDALLFAAFPHTVHILVECIP